MTLVRALVIALVLGAAAGAMAALYVSVIEAEGLVVPWRLDRSR